jgi:hypothetical protein
MVMTLGIISVSLLAADVISGCCCGVLGAFMDIGVSAIGLGLGIPAWIMGQKDLAKMASGLMDDRGRGNTQAGWICGMIGTIVHGLGILCSGGALVFFVFVQGLSMWSSNSGFGGPTQNPGPRRFEAEPGVPRLQYYLPNRNLSVPISTGP